MQQIPVTAANTQALRAFQTKPRHHAHGAVALEFLMLFPFVMAMLYGAAVYGLTFFAKYQMQNAVDRAVETALYLDRSAYDDSQWQTAASQRAKSQWRFAVARRGCGVAPRPATPAIALFLARQAHSFSVLKLTFARCGSVFHKSSL